ncbi:uncharacterized protein MONOS_16180 [Monocercomonoides exilis]|uniref:uncharacterized protein n=1 Tax=Monocercomonoides exilis TaxID=2049356 RepID=UPI003559D2BE|nr:hypothetical protein MONOS_16180 [Monocercomonoides exilis]|eukprot:MONOS_16180.1-p1 / transcript=MONOS_16180.1 / gene=MONOS_16180 / organism=Monocercomonoides_exilis_PA203 / gene_product=unspecified product / transcript_product=unspecified product / location=Mono_scaffold01548:5731-6318(-) / protein_length=196 / sequence_SO=supercontig / SO=protein_coding / is_pseudo=false
MMSRIRTMHCLLHRIYLNRCAQIAAASGASRPSSSFSSISLRGLFHNKFLTGEELQMRRMRQQFGRRRKRQYFVLPPDVFEALQLFAEFRMVERYSENLEKRKGEREGAKEREREARNERREERRIREMIKMRKELKPENDVKNNDDQNENKLKTEENESLSLMRRNSLKETKKNEENEVFHIAPSSAMKTGEER